MMSVSAAEILLVQHTDSRHPLFSASADSHLLASSDRQLYSSGGSSALQQQVGYTSRSSIICQAAH